MDSRICDDGSSAILPSTVALSSAYTDVTICTDSAATIATVQRIPRPLRPNVEKPARTRLKTAVFYVISIMLMLHGFLLVAMLFFGDLVRPFRQWFGEDWYTNLLIVTLGSAVLLAVVAVPYTILSFIRGTGNRGAMIGVLVFTAIAMTCTFGLLAFFSILTSIG